MDKSILSYCDSREIETLANEILIDLCNIDWSSDLIIRRIITELTTEKEILSVATQQSTDDTLKENLRAKNKIADDDFVCFKQFVEANTHSPNKKLALDAMDLWELTCSHELMLHKLSYERLISLNNALLTNLSSDKFKSKINRLIGVAERINKFSESTAKLESAYSKWSKRNSDATEMIAPSIQKNTVRKIINDSLVPHLENASNALPEQYEEIFNTVCEAIDSLNIKVRIRKTQKINQNLFEITFN